MSSDALCAKHPWKMCPLSSLVIPCGAWLVVERLSVAPRLNVRVCVIEVVMVTVVLVIVAIVCSSLMVEACTVPSVVRTPVVTATNARARFVPSVSYSIFLWRAISRVVCQGDPEASFGHPSSQVESSMVDGGRQRQAPIAQRPRVGNRVLTTIVRQSSSKRLYFSK